MAEGDGIKLIINEKIRNYRKELGLTQEQLAEAVGVTVGAVSKWESGLSNPDINMLPVLADFFGISVDVLLGYQLNPRTDETAARKIRELRLAKRYDEGEAEADKVLQRFPNHFDVVYQSAVLFHFKGIEKKDTSALHKSLQLYHRARGLIFQNTDPSVSELLLQGSVGEIYFSLGETDKAVEHLKKYNPRGVNSAMIGFILASKKRSDEAYPYLSESLIENVTGLFRTVIGLANCYANTNDNKAAIDVLQWILGIIGGLKIPGKISYLDKLQAILFSACAQVAAAMGDAAQAESDLRQAIAAAKAFDAEPDYDSRGIRFYSGKAISMGDDFGETAMGGIEAFLASDESVSAILTEIWRRLANERK